MAVCIESGLGGLSVAMVVGGKDLVYCVDEDPCSSFNRPYTPRRRVALMHLIWLTSELRQAFKVGAELDLLVIAFSFLFKLAWMEEGRQVAQVFMTILACACACVDSRYPQTAFVQRTLCK